VKEPVRTLLTGLVDYAGLFPPAGRSMSEAVREYAGHRAGPYAWMLGRFVVPDDRLDEFASSAQALLPAGGEPWRVSLVLAASSAGEGVAAAAAFNAAHAGALCDTAEVKAATIDEVALIARSTRIVPLTTYVEIPAGENPAAPVGAIGGHGLRAKIRTGGVSADAFPSPADVVRFLGACVRANVAFKATAGLHHPLRGEYPLTYEQNSARAPMYGFLNVFLAAALLRDGGSDDDACALLTESDSAALTVDANGIVWRRHRFLPARLAQLRSHTAVSFGSCSFDEPVRDLGAMGLLA
jgi:hypothetical protein